MGPLLLAAVGVAALVAAMAILRSFGPRYRVGRLLAVVARITIPEAIALALSGEQRYVRIDGRVDSEEAFEDADHRPLVLRRTATAWQPAGGTRWISFESNIESVPFVIREGLDEIAVDASSIAEGLITVAREHVGHASDLEAMTAAGIDPAARARMEVGHASTVDHAAVLGVPARAADGRIVIGPGLGRPVILSTLEDDEAMRVLTGGALRTSRLAMACLAAGAALIGLAAVWWLADAFLGGASVAFAASPEPTLRPGTDTRTSGGGPGLVGDPLLAVIGVFGVAFVSLVGSLAYVRFTGGRRTLR